MVITRSQTDRMEQQERIEAERMEAARLEAERIEVERMRRLSQNPPESPAATNGQTDQHPPTISGTGLPATTTDTAAGASFAVGRNDGAGSHSSARSQRSHTSVASRQRRAELAAKEKLLEIERKKLDLEAELVKERLAAEVASIQDEEAESLPDEQPPHDHRDRVTDWLQHQPMDTNPEPTRGEPPCEPERRQRSPSPEKRSSDIALLARELRKMNRPRPRPMSDLPTFSGAPSEWLPFKAAVRDFNKIYELPAAEQLLRLRSCLKGEARDSVAALLHTATDPAIVMKTLEQCFGRPEIIVDRAFEDLKKLPRPGASATELNSFAIRVQNIVCVLQTIDRRGYLHNPTLAREVLEKLSPHIRSRWCDYAEEQESTTDAEIILLSRFLIREADRALKHSFAPALTAAPARTSAAAHARTPAATQSSGKRKVSAIYTTTETTEEAAERCPSCEQAHPLARCPTYKALSIDRRWDFVRERGLCFKCVAKKHRRSYCKAKPCGVNQCRRPHHPTLHEDAQPTAAGPSSSAATESAPPSNTEAVLSVAISHATSTRSALLKMCPVTISGPRGEAKTYALLDEGATVTLIDEELARSVGAEGPSQPLHLHGVNMSQSEENSKIVAIHVRGRNDAVSHPVRARTVKNLTLHQQAIPSTLLQHEHLQDLLQDEVCYQQARPGILIGTDHWEMIVSRELRIGAPGQPAGSRTQLGWVIHGTMPRSLVSNRESVLHVYVPDRRDQQLHDLVEQHFKIDSLGVSQRPRVSEEDQRAKSIVEGTLRRIDGGYEAGLPWRHDHVTMPPSYKAAERRLRKLEEKMDASPDFEREYTAHINHFLEKGYAAPCDGTENESRVCWYLPHFAVQNPNKPGKWRLVFDAAARSCGTSLNDHLLEGPDLLISLQGIVFRFREKPIAVTADIQEMFLRVKIRPEDQPAQQFLWRGRDRTKPPRHYKMTSMIFGAASSPFMAHTVRNYNAQQHAQTHPRALEAITRSHYMDDLVDSYSNEEEARLTIAEINEVHAAAGFTLRKWSASHNSVLRDVPRELRATAPSQLGTEGEANKILGLHWDADRDELGFNTSMNRVPAEVRTQTRAPTKREALSAVMSIYDPLGLLSHYTIRAKIILQSLWRLQTTWDEPIPAEEAELFTSWLRQLTDVARLRLRRCYAFGDYDRIELHILCDASEQAYATVAYWRVTHRDGSVTVTLIAGKAKVAPRRTQSIPRLELQAAVIGARLADTIKREHRVEIDRTVYWTDSATVVHWVRHDARRYTPFVAHRLGELAELTHKDEWRWLPTEHNVADDATRQGHTRIDRSDRWFQGPGFLREPEESWPIERGTADDQEEVLHITEPAEKHTDWLPEPTRFSKYETLVRAAARALAFTDLCRRRATRMELRHIERAERELWKRAQLDSFAEELERLKAGRRLPRSSRLYKLDPVMEDGVMRVRGRIGAADAPAELKRPVILDGRHHLTKLIVLREHCAAGHANRERVTNDLRQRYWIVHLRPTVRAIEHQCALCRVRKAKPQPPAIGDLPRARLDPFHRPFTNCGVDYFGPMTVKVGRRREKRWGALFTCLTMRAVHIEVVPSLSTDSALMALRRMAARRGWPRIMHSDNATNFRGADHELKRAYEEWMPALRDEGLKHRMEWRYIAPGAPNQGGAWERMVRSVKAALRATLQEKAPSDEVLQTVLTEAEHTINARPLTHVSVNPRDPEALTPNHFLLGSSTGLPTTGPCEAADRRTWRASQALADSFWRRWLHEYLPTLVPRGGPASQHRALSEGDIVVVVDHTLPRNVWPLGHVERVYAGPDGGVRIADVRTRTGTFRRPVSKLAVLVQEEATRAAPGGEM